MAASEQQGFLRQDPGPGRGLGAIMVSEDTAGRTLRSAPFELSGTGTVVAAVVGRRIKVFAIKLNAVAASSVAWRSGPATPLEGAQSYVQYGGYTESVEAPYFLFGTAPGESLDLVVAGQVAGRVSYWDDDTT